MFLSISKFTHGRRVAKKVMLMPSWYDLFSPQFPLLFLVCVSLRVGCLGIVAIF